ncbi:AbrB family transcriptional regulator [Mangrovicella endophytica]|uniref:AbrB family transcriptional regulator n=1 Tax=Mangrovicella endophytica TaxID=2066697 RepID=UPI000C9E8065|nr:AbrB family transcriptional regulator [Mangrovicella endophytica]
MNSQTRRAVQAGITLLIAAAGGGIAALLSLPIPWLLGPTIAVSLASIAGVHALVPERLREIVFFVLGIQSGSAVSPEVLGQLAIWPFSFAMQMAGVLAVVVLTFAFLRRVYGWDRQTALFASLPGALSFVLAAATETRSDITRVTVVQSVRLLFLIGVLTPVLSTLEARDDAVPVARGTAISLYDGSLLFAVCLVLAILGRWSRVPGGLMLGALMGSAVLHGSGITTVALPIAITIPGLVVLGALIGSRLRGIHRGDLLRLLPASVAAFVIGVVASGAAVLGAVGLLGIEPGKVVLAYAPGALEALTVLAYQFDLDPTYVAAHHVFRFICIAMIVPLLARRFPKVEPPLPAEVAERQALPSGVDRGED